MIHTLAKTENQYLVKRAVTWEQFKTLQSAFDEIGGVRMVYCEGELEIMGIGLLHEMISSLLGMLLGYYFVIKRIRFTSTGAYTQTIEPRLEFQADLSFAFGNGGQLFLEISNVDVDMFLNCCRNFKVKLQRIKT